MSIPLGFEVGTGARVSIPLGHTIVLGQTQLSGKTTTLQAMTERSGVCAIAFITKRGEKSFRGAREIPPYFTETSVMQPYWKFVCSMIEGVQDMKLGFRERGWVMQLCRDYELSKNETDAKGKKKRKSTDWEEPKTLRAVLDNARKALAFTKGVNELICLQLVEYLQMAVPELEDAKLSNTIKLQPGINVMDLSMLSMNVQSLVLRSVVEWVYTTRRRTVVIIPEAWKFLPEGRSTPVSFPVEELIRQGAALQNFVWIDLQDLRGIKKLLLRSIQVWLFGVQREKNEVANTLKSMPTPEHKPSASEMMQLGVGQFIAAYGNELKRVYVWPAGMEETHAQAIALGHEDPKSWKRIARALDEQEKGEKEAEGENPAGPSDDADGSGLPGVQPARPVETPEDSEDEMWKEKYEALRIPLINCLEASEAELSDHELITAVKTLREAHDAMAERIRASEAAGESVFYAPEDPKHRTMVAELPHPASNGTHDLDKIYRYVVDRASQNAFTMIQLAHGVPEIEVLKKRRTIEMSDESTDGRLALLIHEKFFDTPQDSGTVTKEFKRRAWFEQKTSNAAVLKPLAKIAEMGFLTRDGNFYQSVKSMKVNILEAK
jgi:hypothetical protein